jgi:pimeloyl-ACP methyl ester carboxylesterase
LSIATPLAIPELTAADYDRTRRFAETRFGRIAYVERGAGPAALFLHGFPLNGFQWRGVLPRLSPYRRCIAPDFLAMGHSEVAKGQQVDLAAQTEMLVSLLDALGIDRADLVANDSGGAVAQLVLARHPGRVRTVLLTNCDVENDCPPTAFRPIIALAKRGRFAERIASWRADKSRARSAPM